MIRNRIRQWGEALVHFFIRYSSLFAVLLIWEILIWLKILDYRFFPAPSSVIQTLFHLFSSGEIIGDIAISLQRMAIGFAIGAGGGLVLGLIMGWSRLAERLIDPLISAFYPLPKTALLPLILIIFGIGEASKVAIVALAVFFTVVISTTAGVHGIEPVFLDAARNYGAKGSRMFLKVVIPGALPDIFTGLRLGMGIAMVIIVAAEFVAANRGLGHTIWLAWGTLSTGTMYAGLIIIAVIGLLSTGAMQWLAQRLMPWHIPEGRAAFHGASSRKITGFPLLFYLGRIPRGILEISRQYLYEIPRDAVLPEPVVELEGLRFEWIGDTNVNAILPWKGQAVVHQFQRNLNRGMIGIFAFLQDRVIGYMWGAVRKERFSLDSLHYPIEVGDAYIKGAEVASEYRRRGVASAIRYRMVARLRENTPGWKISRICGTVLVQNSPVMKMIERQGSVRIQEFIQLRLTPYVFIRWIWDWDPGERHRIGSGRLNIRYKVPKFLSDPRFQRIFGQKVVKTGRVWQPRGDA